MSEPVQEPHHGGPVAVQEPVDQSPDVETPELTRAQAQAINGYLAAFRQKYGNLRFLHAAFRVPWPLTQSQYQQYRQRAVDQWLQVMELRGWDLKSKVHVNGPYPAYTYRGDWQGVPQLDRREFRAKAAFQLRNPKPAGFEVVVSTDSD